MKKTMQERSLVWVAAALTFALLALFTGFFTFGAWVPLTIDMNPGLYYQLPWHFPPAASFSLDYWLGTNLMPQDFQPMSLLAHLPAWMFFSGYYPLFAALSLLACYGFLREMRFRRGVAILGGLLYAWQGDMFSNIMAGHFSSATVWLTFALAAFFAVRSARCGSWFWAACCGVCTGMTVSLLPDQGGLCSLLVGGLLLVELWRCFQARSGEVRQLARLLLVVVVAVCVAAPGITSTLSWTTGKSGPAGVVSPREKFAWATQWSYTPEEVLNYFIPGFLGWRNDSSTGPYWGRIGQAAKSAQNQGMRNFALSIFSLGTAGFVLAVAGGMLVWRRKRGADEPVLLDDLQVTHGKFAAVAAVICWILALGKYTPLYAWFYLLPYMDTWRNPLKFLAPASLALVILAACAAQVWSRLIENEDGGQAEKRRVEKIFRVLAACMGIAWVLSYPARLPLRVALDHLGYNGDEVSAIFATLGWSLFLATLFMAFLGKTWRILECPPDGRKREFINPLVQQAWDALMASGNAGRTWLVALAVVTVAQMFWVQSHYVQLYEFKAAYAANPLVEKLRPSQSVQEYFRISTDQGDPVLHQYLSTVFPYFGIQCLDIPAASRIPGDYEDFFKALEPNHARLLQLAGVKYLVTPVMALPSLQEDPVYRPILGPVSYYALAPTDQPGAPTHAVVELKGYLPKAWLVSRVEVMPDTDSLFKRLADPQWNPLQTLLIREEEAAAAQPRIKTIDESVKKLPAVVEMLHYDGRRIEVRAQTPGPGYLLIDDYYDEGWSTTINGAPATMFRADGLLRAVSIPAGVSNVVMTYSRPMTAYYVQLVVLAVVGIWALIRLGSWWGSRVRPAH